jgi:hypothetical protein
VGTSNCTHVKSTATATTVIASDTTWLENIPKAPQETIFNVSSINIAVDQAIANAGATGHFVLPGTPVTNITPSTNPLVINLPDG